jgi:hypothetical protein
VLTYGLALYRKPKANHDLIARIKQRLATRCQRNPVTIHWVKGHAGVPGNERADQLANAGVADSRRGKLSAPSKPASAQRAAGAGRGAGASAAASLQGSSAGAGAGAGSGAGAGRKRKRDEALDSEYIL